MRKIPIIGSLQDPQTYLLARIVDEIAERNFRALRGIIEQAEIIQIEGRLTQLRDAVIRYQEAVILKLEEIEDNRLDEVTAFVKQALQVPSND